MNHVAHQTIVMQFILELAKSLELDPRGCVRAFFSRLDVTQFSLSAAVSSVNIVNVSMDEDVKLVFSRRTCEEFEIVLLRSVYLPLVDHYMALSL